MTSGDDGYRYSVTWIDCQSTGKNLGRSVLTRGDHARLDELPVALQRSPDKARRFAPRTLVNVPVTPPSGLLNPLTVGAFNEFWFRKAPRFQVGKPHHMTGFFHPLDGVGSWNRLYGTRGFLQYQFVVGDEQAESVRKIIERLTEVKLASFLAVLKRFGPGDPGPLSFPMPGWTLALDLPVGSDGLDRLLDEFDEEVASVGGRVYLAKDSRLAPDMFERMYPDVDAWRAVRDRIDPENVLQSDLSRRLGLTPDTGAAARPWPTPARESGTERATGNGAPAQTVAKSKASKQAAKKAAPAAKKSTPANKSATAKKTAAKRAAAKKAAAAPAKAAPAKATPAKAAPAKATPAKAAPADTASAEAAERTQGRQAPGAAGAQPGTGRSQR
jgi:hypothetical protein